MSRYTWAIIKDHIANLQKPDGTNDNAHHMIGPIKHPLYSPEEIIRGMKKNGQNQQEFRMLDDDGELYYEGLIVGDYDGFEPLDDFGAPNAGCTTIQYKNEVSGKWEDL